MAYYQLFTEYFDLNIEVPFVDVPVTNNDFLGFICPFSIKTRGEGCETICSEVDKRLSIYFNQIIKFIKNNDDNLAFNSLIKTHEPNEYKFGYSICRNQGRGNGEKKIRKIIKNVKDTIDSGKTGELINDPRYWLIRINKIGPDTISDIIGSVCRDIFVKFTMNICEELNLTTNPLHKSKFEKIQIEYFNEQNQNWETNNFVIPIGKDSNPIILVPKTSISKTNHTQRFKNVAYKFLYNKIKVDDPMGAKKKNLQYRNRNSWISIKEFAKIHKLNQSHFNHKIYIDSVSLAYTNEILEDYQSKFGQSLDYKRLKKRAIHLLNKCKNI